MRYRKCTHLVRDSQPSSTVKSVASKSKLREKLIFDPWCTNNTCTLWHWIRPCVCVKILKTTCSIVDCSSKIIRARSKSTWFLLISSCDFSKRCAFLNPIPQNCRYLENTSSSDFVKVWSPHLFITYKKSYITLWRNFHLNLSSSESTAIVADEDAPKQRFPTTFSF